MNVHKETACVCKRACVRMCVRVGDLVKAIGCGRVCLGLSLGVGVGACRSGAVCVYARVWACGRVRGCECLCACLCVRVGVGAQTVCARVCMRCVRVLVKSVRMSLFACKQVSVVYEHSTHSLIHEHTHL